VDRPPTVAFFQVFSTTQPEEQETSWQEIPTSRRKEKNWAKVIFKNMALLIKIDPQYVH